MARFVVTQWQEGYKTVAKLLLRRGKSVVTISKIIVTAWQNWCYGSGKTVVTAWKIVVMSWPNFVTP